MLLIIVSAIGAGIFTYTSTSPHLVTATAFVTNTSIMMDIKTVTSYSMTTSLSTVTASTSYALSCNNLSACQGAVTPSCQKSSCQACYGNSCNSNWSLYYCSYYACYYQQSNYANAPYYNNNVCQPSSSSNSTVQCSGYLHQDQNGCTELAVPFLAPWLETQAYQYYTLSNLPSSHPPTGSWVTVAGQLQQGYFAGSYPYGSACPGNTIDVSSIN
jgi:hypothetical protein